MNTEATSQKSPLKFYILVVALTIPFYLLGALAPNLAPGLPMNLPISALATFCPLLAALILVHREDKRGGIRRLLQRVFDLGRIQRKIWVLPIIFLMPMLLLLSYGMMLMMGRPLPEPRIPLLSIPVLFGVFFIAAIGEEAGWMGYLVDPMLARWNALQTGVIMGVMWAIWHFIPFLQTRHGLAWVAWQCFVTVLLRILMVWLYTNTGKSLFGAVLFHDMINVSDTLFPNNGSHYDPAITGAFLAFTVGIVVFLWGAKTLARYRYGHR